MISDDKDIYYFNGDNSYLAFQTMRGQNPLLRTTSVNIETASEEGLIVFYAEGSEAVRFNFTQRDRGRANQCNVLPFS